MKTEEECFAIPARLSSSVSSAAVVIEKASLVDWLQSQKKAKWTIREIVIFAKRYGHVLDSGDASCLASLSPRNRHHAMTALANLAKYQGRYDQWLTIRQRYNLKWSSGNESLQSFTRFFNDGLSLEAMLQQIHQMIRLLPPSMGKIIKFACLTGLRPAEAVESVRLLNSGDLGRQQQEQQQYYNPERQALEHFRFPEIFLRRTKKAYISFLTPEMLQECKLSTGGEFVTYNTIRMKCYHKGIKCDMRYSRKVFASWLHKSGISDTVIDLLQGRTGKSVLVNHYLAPSQDLKDRVLEAVAKLKSKLEQP